VERDHWHPREWHVLADFAAPAEMFLAAGAHYVVPDFAWVQELRADSRTGVRSYMPLMHMPPLMMSTGKPKSRGRSVVTPDTRWERRNAPRSDTTDKAPAPGTEQQLRAIPTGALRAPFDQVGLPNSPLAPLHPIICRNLAHLCAGLEVHDG
jgi:hypothetical protein